MLNPNEIDARHLPPIQAALLKNRSVADEHRISKLYRDAKAALTDPKKVGDTKTTVSRMVTQAKLVIVTCTDVDTGLFIQLSCQEGEGGSDSRLSFGQKFCQEYKDTMRGNVATKIW